MSQSNLDPPTTNEMFRHQSGHITTALASCSVRSDRLLEQADIPIRDVGFVSIGGGIGSFVTADYMKIYEIPSQNLRVSARSDIDSLPAKDCRNLLNS